MKDNIDILIDSNIELRNEVDYLKLRLIESSREKMYMIGIIIASLYFNFSFLLVIVHNT